MANPSWVATTTAWDLAANWTPAAIPVDGEAVFFTGASVFDVSSGLTLGGAGDSLLALNVGADYTGSIGSSGSKLIAGVGITTIRMAARGGKLFVNTAATTDVFLSASGGVTDFFELAGTATTIRAAGCSGSWSITNGAAITNIEQSDSPNCTATIGTGVTALNRIFCLSGRLVNSSAVSGVTVSDSPALSIPLVLVVAAEYLQEVGAVKNIVIGAGGLVRYKSSGVLTTCEVLAGGMLDLSQNRATAVTITNLITHPGARWNLKNALNSVTVTNHIHAEGTVELGKVTAI